MGPVWNKQKYFSRLNEYQPTELNNNTQRKHVTIFMFIEVNDEEISPANYYYSEQCIFLSHAF